MVRVALSLVVFSLLLSACSAPTDRDNLAALHRQERTTAAQADALTSEQSLALAANDFSSKARLQALAQQQNLVVLSTYTPYQGSQARIYGSTALGCIDGAVAVTESDDLKFQHWGKGRNFAHPIMAQYLQDLKQRLKAQGLPPLVVGDIGLQYGGPYGPKSNHASHNTGLDVDLPFFFAPEHKEVASHPDVYIVRGQKVLPTFTADIAQLIVSASSDPRVDRVFVAPMIKMQMCQLYEHAPANGFLHKLRPWFGHQAHMHVRLKCPSDSPNCVSQAPIPAGTGCGYEVESWFLPPPPQSKTAQPAPKPKKFLPQQCKLLWARKRK